MSEAVTETPVGARDLSPDGAGRSTNERPFTGLGAVAAVALVLLALVESGVALVSPLLAPRDGDWQAVSASIRSNYQHGDLIVAAPAWSDQVMRQHLGDLVPVSIAARIDDESFGRIWQISQRGARHTDTRGQVQREAQHGALTLRLLERPPAPVVYDFVKLWKDATLRRSQPGGTEMPCALLDDRHQCPDIAFNFVKPDVLEIGNTLRQTLYAQPVAGAAVILDYPQATLGKQLVVAAGLHHVWFRKAGNGSVTLRVIVDGQEILAQISDNESGFQIDRIDTSRLAGKTVAVRFEVTSEQPFARHFGFAAEARDP